MSKKFFSKSVSLVMCLIVAVTLVVSMGTPVTAESDSEIYLELDVLLDSHFVDGVIDLKFKYMPVREKEYIYVDIYNSYNEKVASYSQIFTNTENNSATQEYNVSWDVNGYDHGTYILNIYSYVYSGIGWMRTSMSEKYYIFLQEYNGWGTDGLYKVYFKNGVMLTEQWLYHGDGWYYVDSFGHPLTNTWHYDTAGPVYLRDDGKMAVSSWIWTANGWLYLGADGHPVTSAWQMDNDGWCYLNKDGIMVTDTWVNDGKGWCFVDENGHRVTNSWQKDSKGWCYIGSNGYCVTNSWQKDSHGWCYLDENGRMVTNKWVKDSKGWCYIGADGYAVTNTWMQDSYGWCYLDSNGSMTKSAWVEYKGDWYYLNSSGYMVTGTVTIGGKKYTFNSSGALVS